MFPPKRHLVFLFLTDSFFDTEYLGIITRAHVTVPVLTVLTIEKRKYISFWCLLRSGIILRTGLYLVIRFSYCKMTVMVLFRLLAECRLRRLWE